MTNKYDSRSGAPPPAYGSDAGASTIHSPQPAHTAPSSQSDYYGASPYQQPATPYQGNGYPPTNNFAPQQENGYYAPGPQMGYAQQGGYGPPGPQGGYYPPQQPGYGGYGPGGYGQGGYGQGGYYGNQGSRGGNGFMEAMLASLACCCCLDACLLF